MPAPDSIVVEVQFDGTTWTDVSSYVDVSAGVQVQVGRNSPFSQPDPSKLTLTLDNTDGRFTPLRQTLVDGTAHPYWPNVRPNVPIRYGWVISSTTYYRFYGFVTGWPPGMKDTRKPRVQINASDRLAQLALANLQSPLRQQIAQLSPTWWTLGDPVDSTSAAGQPGQTLTIPNPSADPLVFGEDGPGLGDGTAVKFAPTTPASAAGQVLTADGFAVTSGSICVAVWIQPTSGIVNFGTVFHFTDGTDDLQVFIDSSGYANVSITHSGLTKSTTGSTSLEDDEWHLIAVRVSGLNAGNPTVALWVDDASVGSTGILLGWSGVVGQLTVGNTSGWPTTGRPFVGKVAQLQLVNDAITDAELTAQYQAGKGWDGELLSDRVTRYLEYGGLASTDYAVDTSSVLCGTYQPDGKSIVSACQDMQVTEGGGSVFWLDPATGKVTFLGRDTNVTSAIEVDAGADLDGSNYQPAYDLDTVVNQVTGTRSTATTSGTPQVVLDQDSIDDNGLRTDAITSYAQSDDDVLYNAQDRLARQSQPGFRLGQVTVDLYTATTSGLAVALAAVGIRDRLRIKNLYAAAGPASQVDVIVEGWSERVDDSHMSVTFDTSPADNPAVFNLDDGTYGRLQVSSGVSLSTALTATATTLVLAFTANPFTTTSGNYPLDIRVGTEDITLTAAPAGSTSPQTFTGCTRGANGTTAAAQSAGSVVTLSPVSTLAL